MGAWSLRRRAASHADDDALTLLALGGPAAAGRRLVAHVTSCRQCAGRLAALDALLGADRRHMVAEADEAFTPARLERQRAAILRGIGGSRAAARILPFPNHGPVAVPGRHYVLRRSIAAAALGGLLIGAAAGRVLDPHGATRELSTVVALSESAAATGAQAIEALQASVAGEEAFLREFEAALSSPQVEPLSALDALTPQPVDSGAY